VCTTLGIGLDLLQQSFKEEAGPAAAAAAGGAVDASLGVAPRGVKRGLARACAAAAAGPESGCYSRWVVLCGAESGATASRVYNPWAADLSCCDSFSRKKQGQQQQQQQQRGVRLVQWWVLHPVESNGGSTGHDCCFLDTHCVSRHSMVVNVCRYAT
jgi:hypothetical protein